MIIQEKDGSSHCEHETPIIFDVDGSMIGEFCFDCMNKFLEDFAK